MYQVRSLLFHYWLKSLFILQIFSTIDCWFPPPDCCGGLWLGLDFLLYATWSLVLWCCWLGGRKGIRPVKTEWWGAGVVVCLELGADGPADATATHWRFSKIQISFIFLVPAYPGSPGKGPLNVCVCVTCCDEHWPDKVNQVKNIIFANILSIGREKVIRIALCCVGCYVYIENISLCLCHSWSIRNGTKIHWRTHVTRTSTLARRSAFCCHYSMITSCSCWDCVLILCHWCCISHRRDHSVTGWRSTRGLATSWGQVSYVMSSYRCVLLSDNCHNMQIQYLFNRSFLKILSRFVQISHRTFGDNQSKCFYWLVGLCIASSRVTKHWYQLGWNTDWHRPFQSAIWRPREDTLFVPAVSR